MPALLFDTCCGCLELRTGCLIIGYLRLVENIILAILVLIILTYGSLYASGELQDTTLYKKFENEYFSSSTSYNFSIDQFSQIEQTLGFKLIALGVILLLVLVLELTFTITLLVGVDKNKRSHVKAYLIYTTITLVLAIILFFVSLLFKHDAGSIIETLLYFALNIYLLLVVKSYYYKMDTNKPAVFRTA